MVLKSKLGFDFNPEKIYGVEIRYGMGWYLYKKYKTMQACLDACKSFKKYDNHYKYRPCHIYYDEDGLTFIRLT